MLIKQLPLQVETQGHTWRQVESSTSRRRSERVRSERHDNLPRHHF